MPLPTVEMLKNLARENPKLKGAIDYIVGELKVGNISEESAKRATNYAERMGRAGNRFNWNNTLRDIKSAGDIGSARSSVRKSVPDQQFEKIDERITDYSLGGNKHLEPKETEFRRDIADRGEFETDEMVKDWTDGQKKVFEDKIEELLGGSSQENLEHGWNRSMHGLDDNPGEDFKNAVKSGKSIYDAISETADKYETDFEKMTAYLRRNSYID